MAAPLNIPELLAPQEAPASAVEQAKYMENAAKLVGGFAQKCAPGALDALLAACSTESPGEAAEQAMAAAAAATAQTETLMAEVERFMSLTRPRG